MLLVAQLGLRKAAAELYGRGIEALEQAPHKRDAWVLANRSLDSVLHEFFVWMTFRQKVCLMGLREGQ